MGFCIIHLILSDYNKVSPKKKATLKAIIHGKKTVDCITVTWESVFFFKKTLFMLLYMQMVFD